VIDKIKAFFESNLQEENEQGMGEAKTRLACAALLIEVAVVDSNFESSEFEALQLLLQDHYGISRAECEELSELAHLECRESTSMYQFTHLVNTYCSFDDKFKLIKAMWTIAFADGDLDKYEEYIIRKVSDLIHLAHGDFIRAKHLARASSPKI
jgi:uncharacterized tellurite resistance protein B-like protein